MTENEARKVAAEVARGHEVGREAQREAYKCLLRERGRNATIALSVLITKGNL